MKRFIPISVLVLAALAVQAVGPKVPCYLFFTPSPSPDVTGNYLYWRTSTNLAWTDSQRWQIATNGQGTDLRVIGLAKGDYCVSMTATNAAGAESDHSTPDFLWHYSNPNKPSNVSVTP